MVVSCWVQGCHSSRNSLVKRSFHYIPKVREFEGEQTKKLSAERRMVWLANINRNDPPSKTSRICSDHFITGKPADLYDKSNPDWAPTLHLSDLLTPTKSARKTKVAKNKMKRYKRKLERSKTKDKHQVARALLDLSSDTISEFAATWRVTPIFNEGPNSVKTECGRLEFCGSESSNQGNKESTLAEMSEITQCETKNLRSHKYMYINNLDSKNSEQTEMNATIKTEFDDNIRIKIEPLSDTNSMDDASHISIKTEQLSDTETVDDATHISIKTEPLSDTETVDDATHISIKTEPLSDTETVDDASHISIKTEPLSDTETVDDASYISIKTKSNGEECSKALQQPHCHSMESLDIIITQSEQSFDMSCNQTPSPCAAQTSRPIRNVRKFPPKERTATLPLQGKIQIKQEFEIGREDTSQRELANKSDMMNNGQLLKEHYQFNANKKRKRFNKSKFAKVSKSVWQWFKKSRKNGVQMSGPLIQQMAHQIAQQLKIKDFKGTSGWLRSWRYRYNVTSFKDDTVGTSEHNCINDFSKVEVCNPTVRRSDSTNAKMKYGKGNLVYVCTAVSKQGS